MNFTLKCIGGAVIVCATVFFGTAFFAAILEHHYHPPSQLPYQQCMSKGFDLKLDEYRNKWKAYCDTNYDH